MTSLPSEPNVSSTELPLPSIGSLVKATVIALALASVLLVFIVLPAEYNIDPTGVGAKIGLTRLSAPAGAETPAPAPGSAPGSEAEVAGADSDDATAGGTDADGDGREDSVVIEVPAGRGLEYKFSLKTGEKMKYEWTIDQSGNESNAGPTRLYFDFHGEPEGDTTGFFESYSISTATGASGTFTAPFDGVHGWYWKNRSRDVIKITLTTSGTYEVLGLR